MNYSLKPAETIPGNLGLPFIGKAIDVFRQEELFYWKHFQRYGRIFKTQIMGMKIAVLTGADANQLVLKDEAEKFSSRVGWSFLEPILGEGILLQDGTEHQAIRKLMYPAFHGQAVARYFNVMLSTVDQFISTWDEQNPVQLIDELHRLTLLVASRLLLDAQTEVEIKKTGDWFLDFVEGQLTILRLDIPLTKYGKARRARRRLEAYIQSVITQRREKGSANNSQDVLGLLLNTTDEDGNSLSDSEVVTQTLQLLFGGHETTTRLLCWLLFELAAHPQWIEKLRQEQIQVVGKNPLAVSHLRQLTQMAYVIKEVERLYPPVYAIPRGVIKDVEFAGYHIPAGWHINISPMMTHRMSDFFAKPELFDPERFAPPREEHKKYPFALISFGGGPHKCLGYEFAQMEMKIVLSTLLRKFNWSIIPERSTVEPILQPKKIERMMQAQVKLV